MSTSEIDIINVDSHRNGSGGTPFITALVDYKDGSEVRRLSITFAYKTNDQGIIDNYATDEDGCVMCFVLDVEGMFNDELNRAYRGDRIAFDHAKEIIAEHEKRMKAKYGYP